MQRLLQYSAAGRKSLDGHATFVVIAFLGSSMRCRGAPNQSFWWRRATRKPKDVTATVDGENTRTTPYKESRHFAEQLTPSTPAPPPLHHRQSLNPHTLMTFPNQPH